MGQTSREPGFGNIHQSAETELGEHKLAFGEEFASEGIAELFFDVFVCETKVAVIWCFEVAGDLQKDWEWDLGVSSLSLRNSRSKCEISRAAAYLLAE